MGTDDSNMGVNVSRRQFMGAALAVGAVTILPGCKFVAGSGSNTIPQPPEFPADIELYQQGFINWARETIVNGVWSCSPKSGEDVVILANWAKEQGYRLRPFGSGHGFAPTLLPRGDSGEKILLVHTHEHMTQIKVNAADEIKSVTAGSGAYIEDICAELEKFDLGLYHTTAPGGISIGGALAMNTHGAAIPMPEESLQPGHSWGSLSNLPLEITAVVWDESTAQYTLKTFMRDEPGIGPLLTCLGRAFITEVKLQVGPNLKIRCQSHTQFEISELLAPADSQTENSFANISKKYGTADIIWYPLSSKQTCWVKTWTVTPEKPESAREVFEPYTLSDGVILDPLAADALASTLRSYPKLSVPQYNLESVKGIDNLMANEDPATKLNDLWGSAYTQTLYVQPLTPRVTVAAWGVIIELKDMQKAFNEFYKYFTQLVEDFKSRGMYPYSGPVELRAHHLDKPSDLLMPNAVEPIFSGARPHPDYPQRDTILWFAINNNVDQPAAAEFNTKLEQWFLSHYASYGIVRPEWTKTYAYTAEGPYGGGWTNQEILRKTFPDTWRGGYPSDSNWDAGVAMLNAYDPHRVFSNSYLDNLFAE